MPEEIKKEAPPAEVEKQTEVEKALGVLKGLKFLAPAVRKALEDLLAANQEEKNPEEEKPVEKSEAVMKAEAENAILKDRLVAVEKALRIKELEPIAKGLGLEVEKLYLAEQSDKAMAGYFVGELDKARKQNEALMKEIGRDNAVSQADGFSAAVDQVCKSEKLDYGAAAAKVAKNRPELWREYTAQRGGGK